MGSSSLLSRLPQYLITAMLEAHVAVATCRVGTAQARASRRAQRQQVFTGPVPCARCVDPSRKKTAQRCQQLQRGAFRASRPRLLTLTPLLAFFAGDADIARKISLIPKRGISISAPNAGGGPSSAVAERRGQGGDVGYPTQPDSGTGRPADCLTTAALASAAR